jgi:predicted ATPase
MTEPIGNTPGSGNERLAMIQSVTFSGYKALADVTIALADAKPGERLRLTVLVGPNGSGKTSILEGIHDLTQVIAKGPEQVFSGPRNPARLIPAPPKICRLSLLTNSSGFQVLLRRGTEHADRGLNGWTAVTPEGETAWEYVRQSDDGRQKWCHWEEEEDSIIKQELEEVAQSSFLRLEPARLAAPSYCERPIPRIELNGEGLASALADLKLNAADRFQEIMDGLRSVIPTVRDVRFRRAEVHRRGQVYMGDAISFDTASATDIPAEHMSEGTLLLLGVLTAFHSAPDLRVLLMDDIDRGLHPRAQQELIGLIRAFQKSHRSLQVIATSHSPYLLDALEHAEIRLTQLDDQGHVVCRPLSAHPDFDKWKQEMSPGEFWSAVGEGWLTDQAVTQET